MSCKACSDLQETTVTSFIRWKNANIEIRACETHLAEVFQLIRDATNLETAMEFGYLQCEKGNNLQAARANFAKTREGK